ncbi:MAG: caspase family protein [Spirochaetes bacterium]|nr:caspase family protein [Spirochaetota bacterium]
MKKKTVFRTIAVVFSVLLPLILTVSCTLNINLPKSYAMVYGISKYIDSYNEGVYPNLTYSDDDAVSVSSMLEAKGYTVITRTDSAASKEQFLADVDTINSEIRPGDLFLFYYSGHGAQSRDLEPSSKGVEPPDRDSDDEWIFLYGSIAVSGSGLTIDESRTFDDDELGKALKTIKTSRKVVIIDSCNSGGFIGNTLEIDRVPQNFTGKINILNAGVLKEAVTLYADYSKNNSAPPDISPSNALVISASGESEVTYESSSLGHGLLTYFFLDTPKDADLNKDGYVTVLESFAYVQAAINVNWNTYYLNTDYALSPHISGGAVDFVLFPAN